MIGWYRYKKKSDPYTDYVINGENIYEHGEIDDLTYIYVASETPEHIVNPSGLVVDSITPTEEQLEQLKSQSLYVQHINNQTEEKIRQVYSSSDEMKLNRRRDRDTTAFAEYDSYVEECRAWGRNQKEEIGF